MRISMEKIAYQWNIILEKKIYANKKNKKKIKKAEGWFFFE
jgi:hypothetical protein